MNKLESRNQLQQRGLRSRIWKDVEEDNLSHPQEYHDAQKSAQALQAADASDAVNGTNQVEDLPTVSMPVAPIPGRENGPASIKRPEQLHCSTPQAHPFDNVDNQPTRPIDLNAAGIPSIPARKDGPLRPGEEPQSAASSVQWQRPAQSGPARTRQFSDQEQWEAQSQQWGPGKVLAQQPQVFPSQSYQRPVVQKPETPALPDSQPGLQPPTGVSAAPTASAVPSIAEPTRRKSKLPLVIVLILLLLLGVGGVVAWINLTQPFAVAGITRTSASFQNANLGIALHYPQGWIAQVDQPRGAVSFYDVNHTDQANILKVAINGQSIAQYIKKEESQLGMTAPKNQASLTFAGATWQQVQGTVLLSGATYTETLLVTTHGNHFYALVQMAPASTYADADHLFFASMRSSLQFM